MASIAPTAAPAPATFTADWLRLREPADHAARDAAAAAMGALGLAALRGTDAPRPSTPAAEARRVVDLGCGTGASLRYLAPRLGGEQHWQVFDQDEALLRAWPAAMADWARHAGHRLEVAGATLRIEGQGFCATAERHRLDLAHELGNVPLGSTDLLCATALIDLVSAGWLAELIGRARQTGVTLSLALMVDGRIEWDPAGAGDAEVALAFARHQGRDKGFGPALGAQAPEVASTLLANAGYTVMSARSDWLLHGGPLQAALIEGTAAAAIEQDPATAPATEAWRRLRTAAVGQTRLRVGHVDLIAVLPPGC
ncbi:MAG: hypothetical protein JNN03_00945 [Rubrivivax sp.]|nr:hypothetical protein [Rubrivivax sp.]